MLETSTSPNPWLDFRCTACVTPPGGPTYQVPGFFAGDGSAGGVSDGHMPAGRVWKVWINPENITGTWTIAVHFEDGLGSDSLPINVSDDAVNCAGTSFLYSENVTMYVSNYDPDAPGFYGKGILRFYGDAPYMRFSNSALADADRYFVTTGTGSPENFLAYREFYKSDKDPLSLGSDIHSYNLWAPGMTLTNNQVHTDDYQAGDPTWVTTFYTRSGSPPTYQTTSLHGTNPPSGTSSTNISEWAGKGVIGALRYLSNLGVNSIYLLPLNLGGDGMDTHPFAEVPMSDIGGLVPTDLNAALHYSVKRMQEWTTVLQFAMQRGIMVNMVLWEQEDENLKWLSYGPASPYSPTGPAPPTAVANGELTWARRLYLKQMAAYFGHLHGVKWTLCEEATDPRFNPPIAGSTGTGNHTPTFTVAEIEDIVAWLGRWDSYSAHPITLHADGNEYSIYETLLQYSSFSSPPAPWLYSTSLHFGAHEDQAVDTSGAPIWATGKPSAEYHTYTNFVEEVHALFAGYGTNRKVVVDVDEQGGWIRGASGSDDYTDLGDVTTYSSYLASPLGRRRTALYDILFSGGNVSWYAGWMSSGGDVGNDNYGGGDLAVDEFRSREKLWDFSRFARERLRANQFWLGVANDSRVSFEIDDGNPATSFGGAEVWENEVLGGAAASNFHIIYYPTAYDGSAFDFGEVDMDYVPYPGPTYGSYFVEPRTNTVFSDSRIYFDGLDLVATSGSLVPTPSAAMISAATSTPALLDYILVIRRL